MTSLTCPITFDGPKRVLSVNPSLKGCVHCLCAKVLHAYDFHTWGLTTSYHVEPAPGTPPS